MPKPWFRVRACVRMATLLCVVFVVLFPSQQTTAAVGINRQLNYQAKLLTSNAVPVADGTYSVIFSLYDAAVGGNRLWTAGGTTSSPSAVSVTLTSGLMTVQLGDTSAGQNALDIDWHQDALYLGVTISADAEMTPRKRLTAVPYAFMAESLQGQFASSSVPAVGGNLFKLQQSSSDAASAPRTALFVSTSGTSNVNDYLIKAASDSEVFTVSRQGHTTTTGNFAANGNTIFGDASTDSVIFNARLNSSLIPAANNSFDVGSASNSWANVYASGTLRIGAGSVSSPAINFKGSNNSGWYSGGSGSISLALNGVGPYLTIAPNANGIQTGISITPVSNNSYDIGLAASSFKNIYASGTLFVGGVTSSGPISPFANNAYDIGTTVNAWRNIYASGTVYVKTDVVVNGSSVCLLSGVNCPTSSSSTDLNWAFNGGLDLITQATATTDLVIGGTSTTTAPVFFSLLGEDASTSRLIIGQNQNMNVVIGGTTSTASNSLFQFSGDDLFVQGTIGSASSVYSNGAFIAGNGTLFGDGFITKTNAGNFSVSTTGNLILQPGTSDFVGIGTSTPNTKLSISRGAETLIHMQNTLSATGDWYEAIGSGSQFTSGRFIISQGLPTASNYEVQFEGGGIVSARTALAAPSFNSSLTGVGTVNILKWTNTGGNFNGYLSVGPTHLNPGTGGADTRIYMGSSVSSTVSIRDWFDVTYFTVMHSGNIGIGTTVPSTTLEVVGTVSSTVISSGRFLPHSNNIYDIGSATRSWANIYASGTVYVNTDVKVGNFSVCLASGVNCPANSSSTDLNWAYNGSFDLMTEATATTDIVIGGSSTTTAPVFFSLFGETASTSRLILGQNQNMDVVIGGTTSTTNNSAFQFSGNDLFVQGNIGSATSVYSNGAFIAGSGTVFGDGFITKTNGALNITSGNVTQLSLNTSGVTSTATILPSVSNTYDLGLSGAAWRNIFASGTIAANIVQADPAGASKTLGASGNQWSRLYSVDAFINSASVLGGTTIVGASTTHQLASGFGTNDDQGFVGQEYLFTTIYDQGRTSIHLSLVESTTSTLKITNGTTDGGRGNLEVGSVTTTGNIAPGLNNTFSLGTGASSWRNIFASGTVSIGANGFINGNLSIGTSTANDRLTVAGSIANLLDTSSTIAMRSNLTVTDAASAAFEYMDVKGNYVYGIDDNDGTGNMVIVDVTDPAAASTTSYRSMLPAGGSGQGVVASGQYVYTLTTDAATADHYLKVTDVSNHSFPVDISTTTMADAGVELAVQGQRAYIIGATQLSVYDISNPRYPVRQGTMNIGSPAVNIAVSGRYAYITFGSASIGSDFLIADISTSTPSIISRIVAQGTTLGPGTANGVAVANGYAYVTNAGSSTLSIIDVTDPVHPRSRANFPFSRSTIPKWPTIQGRNAYVFAQGSSTIDVIDIASSTNPTRVKAFSTFAGTNSFRVLGKYIYFFTNNKLIVYEIPGLETAALNAHSGEFGTLQVRGQSVLGGDLFVGSSLSVGQGGIITNGGITSLSTNTSTFQGAIAFWSSTSTDPGSAAYITPRAFFTDTELTIHATSTCLSSCNETNGRLRLETGGVASIMIDPGLNAAAQIRLGGGGDADQIIFNAQGASDFVPNLDNAYLLGDLSPVLRWRAFLSDATATRIEVDGPSSASTSLYAAAIARPVLPSSSVNGLSVMIATSTSAMGTSTAADIPLNTTIPLNASGLPYQAAGFFVNKVSQTAGGEGGFGLVAIDMTSSSNASGATRGAALVAARKCGSASNTDIAIFATDADPRRVSIRCNGQIFLDNTTIGTGGDYAEYFPSSDSTLAPGEVLALTSDTASSVRRAIAGDRDRVIGVISEKPVVLGNAGPNQRNAEDPNYKVVGLIGQLAVKSSNLNGQIVAGDKVMAGDDGYAVKASGVGMVLGQAMENLTRATGTIMVYVDPTWSADGVLESIDGGTLVRPVAIATSTGMAYDSFGFTFQGSAWSDQSATTISSNFTLVNDVITASSSVFTVRGASNQGLLTISDLGNVGVSGDLTVGRRLFLGSKMTGTGSSSTYLYVDDTLAPSSTYIATNADGWATSSTYDYAERFHSNDVLATGDLVVADQAGIDRVKRAATRNDVILGIVSTRPGFVTGAHSTGTYPIALAGRVPTRVSTKNGPIVAGDQLAPSDDAGVAVKAIGSGPVVGIALEAYDAPVEGKISVFVQPGWKGGEIVSSGTSQSTVTYQTPSTIGVSSRTGLAKIMAGSKQVNVSFQSLNVYPLVTVAPYGQTTNGWWLTDVNDHGFTIVLGDAPMFDLVFAWKAEPSQSGNVEWYSDGTSAPYDVTSGLTSSAPAPVVNTSSTDSGTTTTSTEMIIPQPSIAPTTTDPGTTIATTTGP